MIRWTSMTWPVIVTLIVGCSGMDESGKNDCLSDADCLNGFSCQDGICEKQCTPHASTACDQGVVYWVDSCGTREGVLEDCDAGCNEAGTGCKVCAPRCAGICCGDDGCGGACPDDCSKTGQTCNQDTCECEGTCNPNCTGKCAGAEDGCFGTCPTSDCPGPCCGSTCCQPGQVCDATDRCCTPRVSTTCQDGVIYFVDSCGNQEEVKEHCTNGCNASGTDCEVGGTYVCDVDCNWEIEPVDLARIDQSGRLVSAAFDSGGALNVAFLAGAVGEVRYGRRTQTGWSVETVYVGGVSYSVSLALDRDDHPYLGFISDEGVTVWNKTSGLWETEIVDEGIGMAMDGIALMLDDQDRPHLVYDFREILFSMKVRYARPGGGQWDIFEMDGLYSQCPDAVLDGGGLPQVAFDDGSGQLHHAKLNGTVWDHSLVMGGSNLSPDIEIDEQGSLHLVFTHNESGGQGGRGLHYAHKTNGDWNVESVPMLGNVGDASLTVDPEGRPHIAFRDESQYVLRYSRWDGSQWRTQTVDGTTYTGHSPFILISPDGIIHIVYNDGDYFRVAKLVP